MQDLIFLYEYYSSLNHLTVFRLLMQSILCNCQISVIIYNRDTMKMFEYASHEMSDVLNRYASYGGPDELNEIEKVT